MADEFDLSQGKSPGDLGREALWFILHTLIAVALLALMVFIVSLTRPDIDASGPKVIGTLLAFLIPMFGGFIIAKSKHDPVAGYIWISGCIFFALVCVWVIDLPTGPGLCEKCGAIEKLYRTFFDVTHGSGLMGGDGLLVGSWIPLSMIGYAVGARFALAD